MLSKRRSLRVLAPALAILWIAIGVAASQTAAKSPPQKNSSAPASSFAGQGKKIFTSSCAQCHGLDGKGSERAPNIADRPNVQRLSDAQISHIVENGVPGTGMPAFHSFQPPQIRAVVGYLRTLQGKNKAVSLPGNPATGKTIFSGKAGCSECHMVAGEGGFIASDLSEYARSHTVEQIRAAIVDPASGGRPVRLVTVALRSGEKLVGRVRDEDNFSVQLQTLDGTFHFLSKSDIDKMDSDSQPLMPSNYGSKLDAHELNDVISYLMNVAGSSGEATAKKIDEWEQ
jgi:cytochrome c oxidase cbb3-type subunit III